ncbi:MAG: metallophosphoesterase [Armatimonadota bacterium]
MYLPLNGPAKPGDPTPIVGAEDRVKPFQKLAGPRYPRMANYSFDYGDAHFLCLDSNVYIDSTNADLQKWIDSDLAATNARWKFVAYHHPAFNVGTVHYREQHMRMLSPLFEKHGVDVCLNGHEHVYQRCVPLRFQPGGTYNRSGDRRVPGTFTCDRKFDGKQNTRPEGVLYITTGAGGAGLYNPDFDNNPEKWLHPDDNNVDYVTRFISSTHSFTVFDMTADELIMTQIGEEGQTLDQIRLTKSA